MKSDLALILLSICAVLGVVISLWTVSVNPTNVSVLSQIVEQSTLAPTPLTPSPTTAAPVTPAPTTPTPSSQVPTRSPTIDRPTFHPTTFEPSFQPTANPTTLEPSAQPSSLGAAVTDGAEAEGEGGLSAGGIAGLSVVFVGIGLALLVKSPQGRRLSQAAREKWGQIREQRHFYNNDPDLGEPGFDHNCHEQAEVIEVTRRATGEVFYVKDVQELQDTFDFSTEEIGRWSRNGTHPDGFRVIAIQKRSGQWI